MSAPDGAGQRADGGEPAPTDFPVPVPADGRSEAAVPVPVDDELAALDELPLAEHPARYEHVHERLRGALAEIDDA